MFQEYMQTTYETCLAVGLLQAIGAKITRKLELACIDHSLRYSKDDFVIGHLDFVRKKYRVSFQRFVDNKFYRRFLKGKGILSSLSKINTSFIDSQLAGRPILIIDTFYLGNMVHCSHWVAILSKENRCYELFDPGDGKPKTLPAKQLSREISSLRNRLNFCLQLLVMRKS